MNFALGLHGRDSVARLVRLDRSRRVTRFRAVISGSILSLSVPRQALGNPPRFRFTVIAAREGAAEKPDAEAAAPDYAPESGTFRYVLSG